MVDEVRIAFAMLLVDGVPRLMCEDCSKRAETMKILRRKDKSVVDGVAITLYEIIPPHTLDDCRRIALLAHCEPRTATAQ